MKKDDIYDWIASKSATIERNPFFDVCIDEAIELAHNTTINGYPIADESANHYKAVVSNFAATAKQLLLNCPANGSLSFREIRVDNYYHRRNELLSQLSQLASLY